MIAQEPLSWIGQKVASKYRYPVKVGNLITEEGSQHRTYIVTRTEGDWLWVGSGSLREGLTVSQVIRFDEALDSFTSEMRSNPANSGAHISDSNGAISLEPNDALAFYNSGCAWYYKKEYDKAIADYNEAIRLNPRYVLAFNDRGNAWSAKKEYDRAIADYNEAIRLDPKNHDLHYNRGNAWSAKKQYDKAIADYNEAIRLDPNDSEAFKNRGNAWSAMKDYDKAIADYSEVIRLDPKKNDGYFNRGNAWCSKKEYDKAIPDYTEAIRLDPNDAAAFNNRGSAWRSQKEYDKAIADYNETIRLDPKNSIPFNCRAWLWATCPNEKFRDGNRAVDSATGACELSEWKNAGHIDTLAAAYAETGDFGKAVEWQEKATKLYTDAEDKKKGEERLKLYKDKKPYRATD